MRSLRCPSRAHVSTSLSRAFAEIPRSAQPGRRCLGIGPCIPHMAPAAGKRTDKGSESLRPRPPLHKGGLKMISSTTGNCDPDAAFLPEKSGRPWATALALYACSVLGVPVFLPGQSGGAGALELPARRGAPITRCPPSTFHFLPCRKAPAWESASARWYFERGFRALPVPSRKYRSFAEPQRAPLARQLRRRHRNRAHNGRNAPPAHHQTTR